MTIDPNVINGLPVQASNRAFWFNDLLLPVILRARDMRTEAVTVQHLSALRILRTCDMITADEYVGWITDLTNSLTAVDEWEAAEVVDVEAAQYAADTLHSVLEEACDFISGKTPEGWVYETDENDPSYAGFYPAHEDDYL